MIQKAIRYEINREQQFRQISPYLILTHSYIRLIYNKTIFQTSIMNQEQNNPNNFNYMQVDNAENGLAQRDHAINNHQLQDQIIFKLIRNDRKQQNMKFLLDLKSIIARQLPHMQKQQIVKLLFDYNHQSMIILRNNTQVVGGICFREFKEQKFAEIALLAIVSTEQIKGFGKKLMNRLKEQMQIRKVQYLLTYGDNLALRFFRKQGFSQNFRMPFERCKGYIKEYDGGTLVECSIHPTIRYSQIDEIIKRQKEFIVKKIKERVVTQYKLDALTLLQREKQQSFTRQNELGKIETFKINPIEILGVVEARWTWQEHQKLLKANKNYFNEESKHILDLIQKHPSSWPFRKPVSLKDVPDYLKTVKEPMDLETIEIKLSPNQYRDIDHLYRDINKIFHNCRKYNQDQSIFYKFGVQFQSYTQMIYKNYKQGKLATMLPKNEVKGGQSRKSNIMEEQLFRY